MIASKDQIPETPVEDEVTIVEEKLAKPKAVSKPKAKAKAKVKPKSKAKPKRTRKKPGPKPWATNKMIIPVDQAEELGRTGVSLESMAAMFGVCYMTIDREFKNPNSQFVRNYQKGQAHLRERVRTALVERGVNGNSDACLIFLSKNLLGYTDRPLVEINQTSVTIKEEALPEFLSSPGDRN